MNASRSKAAEALAPPSRLSLALSRPPIVFFIALSPIFFRGDAFFTAAGLFLDFTAGIFRLFMAGDFRVFMAGDFGAFRVAVFEVLAEAAGAFSTTFLAVFLIPGISMGISLAPALAAFLEAAEFGGAMVWTS